MDWASLHLCTGSAEHKAWHIGDTYIYLVSEQKDGWLLKAQPEERFIATACDTEAACKCVSALIWAHLDQGYEEPHSTTGIALSNNDRLLKDQENNKAHVSFRWNIQSENKQALSEEVIFDLEARSSHYFKTVPASLETRKKGTWASV